MTIFQAVVSGIIQGLTEFFPISSSGHLVLLHNFFSLQEAQVAFDVTLHLGTLCSILIYFRRDLVRLLTQEKQLLISILAGSIPTFIIALIFKNEFESFFGMPSLVSLMLIVTGVFLIVAYMRARSHERNARQRAAPGIWRALIVGVAQGVAIIPGISRSGATIGTALLLGVDKEEAVKFSFFLAIPAILGAAVFKINDISTGVSGRHVIYFIVGGVCAFLAGIGAIRLLLVVMRKNLFFLFGMYCVAVGMLSYLVASR